MREYRKNVAEMWSKLKNISRMLPREV